MAKTNINFNNTTYRIDESSLAVAAAELQSHLSTVMNGTGATINLGGTTYNVDSTKLSAATTAFVSHLGTVSGSGMKVMVNGVEYGVDSTKMSGAIADLHKVLGGLQSGGSEDEVDYEVILPEGEYSFVSNQVMGTYNSYQVDWFTLEEGETYRVIWDGEEFFTKAYACTFNGNELIAIGSESYMKGESAEFVEPFCIYRVLSNNICFLATFYTSATHTVAIYKVVSGSTDSELNEYGFYFGKNYINTTIMDNDGTDMEVVTYVSFNEDGSASMKRFVDGVEDMNQDFPAGTYVYSDHKISMSGEYGYMTVNEDGTQIIYSSDGMIFTLETSSGNSGSNDELNQYGFYFDKVYSNTSEEANTGDIIKIEHVFHEDGSCDNVTYANGVLLDGFTGTQPAGTYTYGDHVIFMDGEEYFTVNEDGTELTGMYNSDRPVFTLESNSDNADSDDGEQTTSYPAPGLYQTGAIALYEEQGADAVEGMMVKSWDELISEGIINASGKMSYSKRDLLAGDLALPSDTTEIGNSAYTGASKLTGVIIPNGVTKIGSDAFRTSGLTSITIPDSVTYIDEYAFQQTNITEVTIPGSVTFIGSDAFGMCLNLTFAEYKEGVKTTGVRAFASSSVLETVVIPSSITTIDEYAFMSCKALSSVVFNENSQLTTINRGGFSYCSGLVTLEIPSGVTVIGESAFLRDSGLKSIIIPDGVTTLNIRVFDDCTSLGSVYIPGGVTNINASVFQNCTSLNNITFAGTTAQWNAITKDSTWNQNVPATEVVCSDGTVSLA